MHGSNGTRAEVGVYAKRLTDVLGEEQVTAIARRSGWLRRVRKVMPLAMVVAVLSTLGSGQAKWLADILRTFRRFAGISLRYKPFHNRLAKTSFPEMFRMLLEATVQKMSQPVLHAVSPKLSTFRDIVIHDGTSFALKDDLRRTWPGRFTEPDGSYRRYFERVDPDIQTAKEAIAWQFRLSAKEYNPKVET